MKLSIVMPIFNEAETIEEIVARVQAVPLDKEIILVDDCSTDGTRDILDGARRSATGVTVIYHDVNQGKGAALRTGLPARDRRRRHRAGRRPRVRPGRVSRSCIQPILEGKADVVFGSRFIGEQRTACSTSGTRSATSS